MGFDKRSTAEKLDVVKQELEIVLEKQKDRYDKGNLVNLLHGLEGFNAELLIGSVIDNHVHFE